MSQPIIVGPYTVDATKCSHSTQSEHECIHDWRIHWGNVDRTSDE